MAVPNMIGNTSMSSLYREPPGPDDIKMCPACKQRTFWHFINDTEQILLCENLDCECLLYDPQIRQAATDDLEPIPYLDYETGYSSMGTTSNSVMSFFHSRRDFDLRSMSSQCGGKSSSIFSELESLPSSTIDLQTAPYIEDETFINLDDSTETNTKSRTMNATIVKSSKNKKKTVIEDFSNSKQAIKSPQYLTTLLDIQEKYNQHSLLSATERKIAIDAKKSSNQLKEDKFVCEIEKTNAGDSTKLKINIIEK